MPYSILVTGAGSGLGHGFAKHYLSQPDTLVIAADKTYTPENSLKSSSPNTTLHKLTFDISSDTSISTLITTTKQILTNAGVKHLDLLIHSAGIRGLVPHIESQYPNDVNAAETLSVMDMETLMRTFTINTAGTFTLLQKLYLSDLFHPPLPLPSASSLSKDTTSTNTDSSYLSNSHTDIPAGPSKVLIMTSRMGSISSNTTGSAYAYRASKAALNAIVKSMSIDVPHVVFKLVHPGRVETGLTKCREEGAIEVGESVEGMVAWFDKVGLNGVGDGQGMFLDRFGRGIGW